MKANVIKLNPGVRHLMRATRAFASASQDRLADQALSILEGSYNDVLPISFMEVPANDERLDDFLVRVVLRRNMRPTGSVVAVQILVAADVPEDLWLGAYGILAGITVRNILINQKFRTFGAARHDMPKSLKATRAMAQNAALHGLARLFADRGLISFSSICQFRVEQTLPKPRAGWEALCFLDWSLYVTMMSAQCLPTPAENARVGAGTLMAFFLSVSICNGEQVIADYALG